MVNIILCGGSGTRLWPFSREKKPKQFCNLINQYSLFQDTVLRNKDIIEKIIIVTNNKYYQLAKTQVEKLNLKKVIFILEPIGRNTAPAVTIACLSLNKDEIVVVSPSDHYIMNKNKYCSDIMKSKVYAKNNYLVTFGIRPSKPDTGFGYIKANGENVVSFHEKPDENISLKYFTSGKYFWNSGMFAFKAGVFLEELRNFSEDIYNASFEAYNNKKTNKNIKIIPKNYMKKIRADSIDCAVMEKSKKIKMIISNFGWADLGSFESIYETLNHDSNGNVITENSIVCNSNNNLIISNKKIITLIDINELIVVDTKDAILISNKGSSYKIKKLIPEIIKTTPSVL